MSCIVKRYKVDEYEFLCKLNLEKPSTMEKLVLEDNKNFLHMISEDMDEPLGELKVGIHVGETFVTDSDGYHDDEVFECFEVEDALIALFKKMILLNKFKDYDKLGPWYVVSVNGGLYMDVEAMYTPNFEILKITDVRKERIDILSNKLQFSSSKRFTKRFSSTSSMVDEIAKVLFNHIDEEADIDLYQRYEEFGDIEVYFNDLKYSITLKFDSDKDGLYFIEDVY